jgi:hypothetical protein
MYSVLATLTLSCSGTHSQHPAEGILPRHGLREYGGQLAQDLRQKTKSPFFLRIGFILT